MINYDGLDAMWVSKQILPSGLSDLVRKALFTGSRYICDPAPLDTDLDIVILVDKKYYSKATTLLKSNGFGVCGQSYGDEEEFLAFRKDEINIILVWNQEVFNDWVFATGLAKKLNLRDKEKRIELFELVFKGEVPNPIPITSTTEQKVDWVYRIGYVR